MASADYQFIHHYGCEPYDASTGGAKITQQNLVITAWGGTQGFDSLDEVFENAQLLIPNPNNSDPAISSMERVATAQGFHSRHSAHTYVQQNAREEPTPPVIMPVGYVLNPPPEFQQDMCGALVFNGGDPTDKANWTAKKSIMSQYDWRYAAEYVARDARNLIANNFADLGGAGVSTQAAYSTYLHLPNLTAGGNFRFPFLKTSGADGVAPQFFDPYTAGGAQEMVAAVNRGEFFVFMEISAVSEQKQIRPVLTVNHTIVWPHSAARG